MSAEIKQIQDEIKSTFAQLNDSLKERVKEEVKGYVDPLLTEKLHNINDAITKADEALEKAEKAEAMTRAKRAIGDVLGAEKTPLRKAFEQFVRREEDLTPEQKNLLEVHKKSMNSGSDPAGGYLVTPEVSTAITKILNETSPIRRYASVQSISSDQLVIPQQTDLPSASWTNRDDAPTETTGVTWKQLTIPTHRLWAEPRVSQDLLDDAIIDVETYLMNALTEAFDIAMNTAFFSGNGVDRPRGLLTYTAGTAWGQVEQVPTGDADEVTAAGLTNLVYSLKDGYLSNAVFMMRRQTVGAIRLLTDANGNSLWTPQFGSEPAQIMGYPVVRAADAQAIGANALPIVFGDFRRGYQIVDRLGVRMMRDPFTAKPFVKFYTWLRTGGAINNYEAIKIQKCSAS